MTSYNTVISVRMGHVDPAGIVYFPRIYDYLHDVFEEVWEEHVGQRYYHLVLEKRLGFPLVHSDVDFRSPLRFGDRPTVAVTCYKLGRSSIGLRYVFKIGERVCVEARQVTSCVTLEDMQPIETPPEFRARFEDLMEGKG